MLSDSRHAFYEFFAGGGMARVGLGRDWRCLAANDWDPAKAAAYRAVFADGAMREGDIAALTPQDLPGRADLAWASFPCQDLSLAGAREGLAGARSSSFWRFAALIGALAREARAPRALALENVSGLLTSGGGRDFAALAGALNALGYQVGALAVDAALFVPQSRPRVFVIGYAGRFPAGFVQSGPAAPFHSRALAEAARSVRNWAWLRLPAPPLSNLSLADVLEADAPFRPAADAARLIALMAPGQRARVAERLQDGRRHVGTVFRRIRLEAGVKVQRAEARFDGRAGCLRTPAGGSSRQSLLVLENGLARSRLLTPRECARLMGLPDDYPLPKTTNAALHLLGDGVAAPVVSWLARHLLEPLLAAPAARRGAA